MKNKQKHIYVIGCLIFVLAIGFILSVKQFSYASWIEEEEGKKYENENGELAKGFCGIEDKLYYFDEDGYLVIGKFYIKQDEAYYYSDKQGVVQTGIVETDDGFYVTDDSGKIQTGFVEYDNSRYFFNKKAQLVYGWFKTEDNWYYADDVGHVLTGLVTVDGYRYYLGSDGKRVSNTVMEIEGITYVFNQDGSIDENATTMYPVYSFLVNLIKEKKGTDLLMNSKLQAIAVLRASDLINGYLVADKEPMESLLSHRGVECSNGFEFSYGGVADYSIERLLLDMQKDTNLYSIIEQNAISEVGLGIYVQDNIYYYDIVLICK